MLQNWDNNKKYKEYKLNNSDKQKLYISLKTLNICLKKMFVVRKCCTDGYTLGSVLDKASVAKDHDIENKLKLYNSEI